VSWFDRLVWRRAEKPEPLEERSLSWFSLDIDPSAYTTAGVSVTQTSMLGLSAAWNAVGLLSDSIATMPVDVFIENGDQRTELPPEARPRWLDKPGNGLNRIDVLGQIMVSLLVHGEALILTPRAEGQVQGLTVLDPKSVILDPDGSYSAVGVDIEPFEIVHIRGLMFPTAYANERRGVGVITAAREAFASGLATQQYGASYFGNGAWVGTVVEVPGPLSETGQKALKAYIEDRHRGSSKAHKIGILVDGAKLSSGPISFNPQESQFLETRQFQVADIARFFRVPPEMIGGESGKSMTYSTLEGRSTHFVKYSLLHWIVRIETALTELWQSEDAPEGGRIKLNVDGLLRGSTKERFDAYAVAIEKGFMTVNEVRALEDLPPLDEPAPTEEAA
jgi:HK97 family phage portal protein